MINSDQSRRSTAATGDEIGKVFVALAGDLRRCLVCDDIFTRTGAAEHATIPCNIVAAPAFLRCSHPHVFSSCASG
jgi:hypothetical protein